MKDLRKLIEFFGEPTECNGETKIWLFKDDNLFHSVLYKEKVIYLSVIIKENLLIYPLNYNTSYSNIKQLLIVNSKTFENAFVSVALAIGIPIKDGLSVDQIYDLILDKTSSL